MNFPPRFALASFLGLCSSPPAQDLTTTLSALTGRAQSVVTARCVSRTEERGVRTVEFERLSRIKGSDPGSRFRLSEEQVFHCGSSLASIRVAGSYLLFLAGGERPAFGQRGIEVLTKEVEDHVAALAKAGDEGTRIRILAAALACPHRRVFSDAAVALQFHPALAASADEEMRGRLLAALAADPALVEPGSLAILSTLARLKEERAIGPAVDLFLSGGRRELDAILESRLSEMDGPELVGRIMAGAGREPGVRTQQVRLLSGLRSAEASSALALIAKDEDGGVRLTALAAILRRGDPVPDGTAEAELGRARAAVREEDSKPRRFKTLFRHGETKR